MSDVSDIGAARWKRQGSPNAHCAREAIERALATFDAPDERGPPAHAIVLLGWEGDEEGANSAQFLQAGTYHSFGQAGLAAWGARKLGS